MPNPLLNDRDLSFVLHEVHDAASLLALPHFADHSLETFAQLLAKHGIEFVADVRSYPYSRFAPHFNKEELQTALPERGVGYVFLGQELGGRPSSDAHYDDEGHALYGPMSQERLAFRQFNYDQTQWVRDAILATSRAA